MRFQFGAIPKDEAFQPEGQGWSDIREPNAESILIHPALV